MICTAREAMERLNVSAGTLRRWAKQGKISHFKTPGGHFRYDLSSYADMDRRRRVAYILNPPDEDRVSITSTWKEVDPSIEVIFDVGSCLDFDRKGLRSLVKDIAMGNVSEVVLSCPRTLSPIAFGFFEFLFATFDCKIRILDTMPGKIQVHDEELYPQFFQTMSRVLRTTS